MSTAAATAAACAPILGIGFVGKRNQPLFIHSFEDAEENPDADLELNLNVHSMLDIIEERAQNAVAMGVSDDNFYLGYLSLFGRFCTYAMMGPTLIKVFIVLDAEHEPTPREEELKRILFALHAAYMDYICNPFVDISDNEDPEPSFHNAPSFARRVFAICETHGLKQQ